MSGRVEGSEEKERERRKEEESSFVDGETDHNKPLPSRRPRLGMLRIP
jgi:hypothetical protein